MRGKGKLLIFILIVVALVAGLFVFTRSGDDVPDMDSDTEEDVPEQDTGVDSFEDSTSNLDYSENDPGYPTAPEPAPPSPDEEPDQSSSDEEPASDSPNSDDSAYSDDEIQPPSSPPPPPGF